MQLNSEFEANLSLDSGESGLARGKLGTNEHFSFCINDNSHLPSHGRPSRFGWFIHSKVNLLPPVVGIALLGPAPGVIARQRMCIASEYDDEPAATFAYQIR